MFYVAGTNVSIAQNRLGRDHRWGLLYADSAFSEEGNIWEDTGQPVSLRE